VPTMPAPSTMVSTRAKTTSAVAGQLSGRSGGGIALMQNQVQCPDSEVRMMMRPPDGRKLLKADIRPAKKQIRCAVTAIPRWQCLC